MKPKLWQQTWDLSTITMRNQTLRGRGGKAGRSRDLLLRRVHQAPSYLDGQFVLDSRSADLWGWEHHTHTYSISCSRKCRGGSQEKGYEEPVQKYKVCAAFYIHVCVCDDGLYHAEDINYNFCSIVCALSCSLSLWWRPYKSKTFCNQDRWNAKRGNTSDVGTYMLCKHTVASVECMCGVNN